MQTKRYAALATLSCALALSAAEPGESVVVVYNSRLPDSRAVANHYASVRHVPSRQVLGLDLPLGEDMTRAEYRDELQEPLIDFLEKEKLFVFDSGGFATETNPQPMRLKEWKIRYAVLCFGVPLRILDDPKLSEPDEDKVSPAFRGRNGAAVDSEVALLPLIHRKLKLTGALRNPCFAVTNAADLNPANGVLMVARLDGPDSTVARQLVDKAIEAETNGLWGRAYFDLRGLTNGDYRKGDDWLRAASETTRRFGFETVVDDKPETFPAGFPMSQIALYAGWYDPNASGPFALPKVEFMPGAFAYHLQSFSAHTLRSATLNWCGPLLAKGVTATMGCIDEPYLDGTPNMEVFFHRWLILGFTYGEAACAAQPALSWETTVVGDPLYHPFGKKAQVQYQELVQRHSPWAQWSILRWVDINLAIGNPRTNFIHLLEIEPTTRQSAVLSEKLADLYRLEGKPEAAIKEFRQALGLHPTPQSTIRLTMTLGEELSASGKDEEALKLYDEFQRSNPAYPDALGLYQKMEQLALKLGEAKQAARYEAEIKKRMPAR
jgi:uncharacterized protein (TIGR03790 family)